jgi:hypothetical protein
MPKINQISLIEMTPEHFLEACSQVELGQVLHLIHTKRFQDRMEKENKDVLAEYNCFGVEPFIYPKPVQYPILPDDSDENVLTCH